MARNKVQFQRGLSDVEFERLYGMSICSLRYGNVYGERQDPLGEAGVIAIFCGKLLAGESGTVFGTGRQTRDYIYVGDVVSANLAAAESNAGGAFNIGTGVETSLNALANTLLSVMQSSLRPEYAPPRKVNAVPRRLASIDDARRDLGFRARISLDDGLRSLVAWWRDQHTAPRQ